MNEKVVKKKMKNVLEIRKGEFPWRPNPTVEVGEVLDRYDVPRTGLLHESGQTYIFTSIMGDALAESFWAYAAINQDEMQGLLALSPEVFDDGIEELLQNRCVTVAFVSDYKLALCETFDAGMEGSAGLADRFMQRSAKRISEDQAANEEARHLMPA